MRNKVRKLLIKVGSVIPMDEFIIDDDDLDEEYYEAEDLGIY